NTDKIKTDLDLWLESQAQTRMVRRQILAGGDICQTEVITTEDGRQFCVKQQAAAPEDFFAAEANGLAALAANGCLRVPEIYAVDKNFIVMEYIAPGTKTDDYWIELGTRLAQLHSAPAPCFGFTRDNYCGRTLQPNPRYDNG